MRYYYLGIRTTNAPRNQGPPKPKIVAFLRARLIEPPAEGMADLEGSGKDLSVAGSEGPFRRPGATVSGCRAYLFAHVSAQQPRVAEG